MTRRGHLWLLLLLPLLVGCDRSATSESQSRANDERVTATASPKPATLPPQKPASTAANTAAPAPKPAKNTLRLIVLSSEKVKDTSLKSGLTKTGTLVVDDSQPSTEELAFVESLPEDLDRCPQAPSTWQRYETIVVARLAAPHHAINRMVSGDLRDLLVFHPPMTAPALSIHYPIENNSVAQPPNADLGEWLLQHLSMHQKERS